MSVPVHVIGREKLTELFSQLLRAKARGWLSYVNVHAINLAQEIPWFKKYLQSSLVAYCDGEGVRLGARILGHRLPKRVTMIDWLEDVCAVAAQNGSRVFFLGATDTVIEKMRTVLLRRYPTLAVAGMRNGYFSMHEIPTVVRHISDAEPDLLIVGMGMPLQERVILEMSGYLPNILILNAGSCFDFVAGTKRRCPAWMGNHGLEWLFRLMLEPRRLWRRYLIGNPMFVIRVLQSRFLK